MSKGSIERLLSIMSQLRDPDSGCPWDLKQTYKTIVPYTIEETYEVADAIEREDYHDLKSELGDLLFQVVFYAQLAKEDSRFEFDDIVNAIADKLERRHPHVFGEKEFTSEQELHQAWEKEKHRERQEKSQSASILDDVPATLPALARAQKIQKRAAKLGFDWPDDSGVWDKLYEEVEELRDAVAEQQSAKGSNEQVEDELGDVLFSIINLSRHLGVDSETALRRATKKFDSRFRVVETLVKNKNQDFANLSIEELELLWQRAKSEV
ncbi:MAG: nucleoside triphosphate pyrophosphohydrolase [Gammaproteobacteria bacterium]|nr:nucleoside triphosphate pyrophosphohydrolase [Gammaproteobacteria bacterium]